MTLHIRSPLNDINFTMDNFTAHVEVHDYIGPRSFHGTKIRAGINTLLLCVRISDFDVIVDDKNKVKLDIERVARKLKSQFAKVQDVFLFYSEIDIFREKVKRLDLKNYRCPDYIGGHDEEKVLDYFSKSFIIPDNTTDIKIHVLKGMTFDKESVRQNLNIIKDILSQRALEFTPESIGI